MQDKPFIQLFKPSDAVMRNFLNDEPGAYPQSDRFYQSYIMLPNEINSYDSTSIMIVDGEQEELEYDKDFYVEDRYVFFPVTPRFSLEVAYFAKEFSTSFKVNQSFSTPIYQMGNPYPVTYVQ